MINSRQQHTLDELLEIQALPPAVVKNRWQGVSHGELVNVLIDQGEKLGWTFHNLQCYLNRDRSFMAATLDVNPIGVKGSWPSDWNFARPAVGIVHANSGHAAMRLYTGLRVVDGSIGIVTDDYHLIRHTHRRVTEDLPSVVAERLKIFHDQTRKRQGVPFPGSWRQVLRQQRADQILLQAGREKIMPWSRIGQIDQALQKIADKRQVTIFDLLCEFGRAARKNQPRLQLAQLAHFFRIVFPN